MAKISFYVISCSADQEMNIRNLYIWGEGERAKWLPETKEEAKKRLNSCQLKTKCEICDGRIYKSFIFRTKGTKLQELE